MKTATPSSDLQAKRQQINDDIAQLKQDAGAAWKAFEAARAEFAGAPDSISEESPEFKAAHEASTHFNEISEKVASAERARDALIDMMTTTGDLAASDETKSATDQAMQARIQDRGAQMRSALERARSIVGADAYEQFSRIASEEVTVGRVALGEAFDRQETMGAIVTGGSSTSAGAFTVADRQPYAPLPLAPLTLLDLITIGETDSDLIDYIRMTSFTNAAAETVEASSDSGTTGQKPQSATAWARVTASAKTIAHWTPVTRKSLRNKPYIETEIRSLLNYGLQARLQTQIIAGDGAGDNVRGILNTSGILHQAAGVQSHADKGHMALTKLRLAFMEPTAFGFHPTDWETIRLSRTLGATGDYLWGPPAINGAETLWGKPVVITPAIPLGTAIVGDWRQFQWLVQEGVQILASDSHVDYFTRNILVLLAEMAGVEVLKYPQAFCDINLAAA